MKNERTISATGWRSSMLPIARLIWIAFVAVGLMLNVLGGMVYFRELDQVCLAPQRECHGTSLATPADVAHLQAEGVSLRAWTLATVTFRTTSTVIFYALAFLIFARKHNEWAGLFFSYFFIAFGTLGPNIPTLVKAYPQLDLLAHIIGFPAYVVVPFFFATFPSGRVVPRVMWIPLIIWSASFFLNLFFNWNPFTGEARELFNTVLWLGMFGSGAAAQVYRYARASNAEEKRQTKWVVFSIATSIILIFTLLFSPISREFSLETTYSLKTLLAQNLPTLLFLFVPISIGIAILRYRLFDIDLLIRRTLQYSLLSGLLAFVYFGGIVVLQGIFTTITGAESPIAVVASTLAIAALFLPLRRRVQDFIDKRFYRRKYDAAKVVADFAATARDETDLDALTTRLVEVVDETMQPESVSLWLKTDGKKQP